MLLDNNTPVGLTEETTEQIRQHDDLRVGEIVDAHDVFPDEDFGDRVHPNQLATIVDAAFTTLDLLDSGYGFRRVDNLAYEVTELPE